MSAHDLAAQLPTRRRCRRHPRRIQAGLDGLSPDEVASDVSARGRLYEPAQAATVWVATPPSVLGRRLALSVSRVTIRGMSTTRYRAAA
jgi:hypothetical protein